MSTASLHLPQDHISAVEAGRQFGYTNDYISRLAREKKVMGMRVGRQWYVDARSLETFIARSEDAKKEYSLRLREERKKERVTVAKVATQKTEFVPLQGSRAQALAKAGMVMCVSVVLGGLIFSASHTFTKEDMQNANILTALREFALRLYGLGAAPPRYAPEITSRAMDVSVATPAPALAAEATNDSRAMVVLPSGDTTPNADIERAFSDQVQVERDRDGKSGIITPIFKHSTSSPYRFLLVPLKISD